MEEVELDVVPKGAKVEVVEAVELEGAKAEAEKGGAAKLPKTAEVENEKAGDEAAAPPKAAGANEDVAELSNADEVIVAVPEVAVVDANEEGLKVEGEKGVVEGKAGKVEEKEVVVALVEGPESAGNAVNAEGEKALPKEKFDGPPGTTGRLLDVAPKSNPPKL